MGALATLTIPLSLKTSNDRYDATQILETVAGSEGLSFNDSSATLNLQFPGNVSSIIKKLAGKVSVPMRSLAIPDKPANPAAMLSEVGESSAISNAHFNGDRFEATVVPSTNTMLLIYESAVKAGLIPQDVPTLVALRGL
jgi:hypothetical protein